jgi:uncharacterized Zn-binding protein involved in type VI secretion
MINPTPSANGPYTASQPYNQRMPDLTLPCDYPYVHFYQYRDGSWERQSVEKGFEERSHGHITGSFEQVDYLGSHKKLDVGAKHNYTIGGKTSTTENNHDTKTGGSEASYVTADHYGEHGNDWMKAIGGDTIHASGGIHFHYATDGTQVASSGDQVSDHNDGHEHINVDGDHIRFTGGTKYDYVGAEHGMLVQGNSDTHIAKNCNLESDTQITITVGSSVITILGQSIVIHDGNKNEIGMNSSKMWAAPKDANTPIYLGGPGKNPSLYDLVATMSGPAINTFAKYINQQE